MAIKESTTNDLFSLALMVMAIISWLMGREFAIGADCLILSLLYRILSRIEKLKER